MVHRKSNIPNLPDWVKTSKVVEVVPKKFPEPLKPIQILKKITAANDYSRTVQDNDNKSDN